MGMATPCLNIPSGEDRDGNVIRGALSTGYRTKEFSIFAKVGGKYSIDSWWGRYGGFCSPDVSFYGGCWADGRVCWCVHTGSSRAKPYRQ